MLFANLFHKQIGPAIVNLGDSDSGVESLRVDIEHLTDRTASERARPLLAGPLRPQNWAIY